MLIHSIRHDWPKNAGFSVDRPKGRAEYTFVHYCTAVELKCNGKTYHTHAGACILVEPGVSYHLYAPEPLVHNWMHLHPQVKAWIDRYQIPMNQPFYPNQSELISEKLRKIEAEFYWENPFREYLLDNYVEAFLIWLHRAQNPTSPAITVSQAVKATMIGLRKQILTNPEKKWTLHALAERAHLSPSRFHAVYKTMFGTTPSRDLIDAKIHSAKALLHSRPELSLKEVAEQLGYNDQYHFIRQFKTVTGQTPGAYRKKQ